MPKYLARCSYSAEGAKGLIKEGGTARRAVVEKMVQALGGKMEAFYYAFGDTDLYVLADMPDAASMAAIALAVSGTGTVSVKTTVLLSPEEIDAASKKTVAFRPAGQ